MWTQTREGIMTTPKAEAMEKAREIRTKFYSEIHATKSSFEAEGDELEKMIASALLSAEKERGELRAANQKLETIRARFVIGHIKAICPECGHTNTGDGCAFCIKANRQYETDLVATLTSERDELKAEVECMRNMIIDYANRALHANERDINQRAEIAALNESRAFLAKQGERI
jgi:uncharacterized coiled-coil DUF342 family protein